MASSFRSGQKLPENAPIRRFIHHQEKISKIDKGADPLRPAGPAEALTAGGMAAVLVGISLCNDAVTRVRRNGRADAVGDPIEAALVDAAQDAG